MLESGGLTVGHAAAEVRELWAAVLREAPRMHTLLDAAWLSASRDEIALRPIRTRVTLDASSGIRTGAERRMRAGLWVASGALDGTVRLWAIKDGPVLTSLEGHAVSVIGVALSADGVSAAVRASTVRLWTADGRCLATRQGHTAAV